MMNEISELISLSSNELIPGFLEDAFKSKNMEKFCDIVRTHGNFSYLQPMTKESRDDLQYYETPLSLLIQNDNPNNFETFEKVLHFPNVDPNVYFKKLQNDLYGSTDTLLTYCIKNKKYKYIKELLKSPRIKIGKPDMIVQMFSHNGEYTFTKTKPFAIAMKHYDEKIFQIFENANIKVKKKEAAQLSGEDIGYCDYRDNYSKILKQCPKDIQDRLNLFFI